MSEVKDIQPPFLEDQAMWICELLPETSKVYTLKIRDDRILIRPHKPSGVTGSGLYVERNENHPEVWGHILAIPQKTFKDNPSLIPGAMVAYKRFAEEHLVDDYPVSEDYLGQKLPISIIHIRSLEAVINPPSVPLPV